MFRCPNCNSTNYHVMFGYGADCEDCGFAKDAEGETVGENNEEDNNSVINGNDSVRR